MRELSQGKKTSNSREMINASRLLICMSGGIGTGLKVGQMDRTYYFWKGLLLSSRHLLPCGNWGSVGSNIQEWKLMFYVGNELKLKKKKQNPVDLSIVWAKKIGLQAVWDLWWLLRVLKIEGIWKSLPLEKKSKHHTARNSRNSKIHVETP